MYGMRPVLCVSDSGKRVHVLITVCANDTFNNAIVRSEPCTSTSAKVLTDTAMDP